MEDPIPRTVKGSTGQVDSTGEEMDGNDDTNHMCHDNTDITSAYVCPPVQNHTHKVEQSDEDREGSQGPEVIQIVKQQISQMLVSKYVKQDKIVSKDEENREDETNPIQSVKQQISNFLLEKYADRQKSISPERTMKEIDKSEKSIPEIEIHTDSNAHNNGNNKTNMNLNSSDNLIEGFSIPDFEADVGDQIAEMNKTTPDNEYDHDELENKPIVNASGVNGTNVVVEAAENITVPLGLSDGNVTFQALEENTFEESRIAPDLISEAESVNEQDVKPEVQRSEVDVQDGEVESQRSLPGPANKVTLDLNTISKLSNIWDKSYRNEKWPKKTKSNPNIPPSTRLNVQLGDTSSTIDENFEIVENTSVTETESEEQNEVKGIHNLQISETLKQKLMNLSSLQPPNMENHTNEEIQSEQGNTEEIQPSAELDATSYSAADATELEGIENLRLSESLKLKLLNIKNMKKLSKSTNKPLKHKKTSQGKKKLHGPKLTALKRKVGRPRKNPLPQNTTNEIPEPSLAQHVAKSTCKLKKKVGRPKLQNAKGFRKSQPISSFSRLKYKSKFKHTSLKSKSKSLSDVLKRPKYALAKNKTLKTSKMTNHTGQKRKVGRPPKSASEPKLKEVDKDNKPEPSYDHAFNLKECFVKLSTVESTLNAIQENGLKVDTTVPTRTVIKKRPKVIKKKPGRPKKPVQLGDESDFTSKEKSPGVDDDIQALVESREDFITNKTSEVFSKPKSVKPMKGFTAKKKTSVKVSSKSKGSVKGNNNPKQKEPKKMKTKEKPKQVSSAYAQVNENTKDDLAKEDNVGDIKKHDIAQTDNSETVQHADEIIPENDIKGGLTGDWEDDWQSEGLEEGDSSDDYFPSDHSDEEYKPKKKKSSKKDSSSQKMKTPSIKFETEYENAITAENENGENIDVKVENEKGKTVRKTRPYKHKGPRIGRPPVLGEYPCKNCDFVAYEKNLVDKHYNEVHKKEWMKCGYCDYSTRSKTCLLEHEGKNHTNSKPFKCEHEGCTYASNVHNDYQRHISQAHTLDKPYKCPKCDYETRWRRNMSNHLNVTHSDVRKYTCEICNRAFKRKTDVKDHMIWHSDEKPHQCDICGFRCKTNWEMKSHRLKHTDIRNYPCTFPGCTQACKTKSDLTKHMVRHKTVRDFKCELCPNSYKCRSSLKKHIQYQHSGNTRNFQCGTCGKAFKVKSALLKHEILHRSDRPFYCDICGSGHTSKSNMEKHKLTHRLDLLPYHCPICPFGARIPNALLAHIGAAHGDTYAYYCEICRKPFRRYAQLRKHYSRMHTEQDYKNLGHPFEIDLALMKMQMELDLEDTFESVGVSKKRKGGPITIKQETFDTEFHNLEEDMSSDSDLPDDEEFEAMERELNEETELPHEFRKLKEAQSKRSEAAKEVNAQKRRGRPKKRIPVETGGLEENLTSQGSTTEPANITNNASTNLVCAEQGTINGESTTLMAENTDIQTVGEISELNVTDKEGSHITPNRKQTVIATESNKTNTANAVEVLTNGKQTQGQETGISTTLPDTNIVEQNSNRNDKPGTAVKDKLVPVAENENTHGPINDKSVLATENESTPGRCQTTPHVNSSNLFDTVLSSGESVSKSSVVLDNSTSQNDAEIASLLSHYCKSNNQRDETGANGKQNDKDNGQMPIADSNRQPDNEQQNSIEPESTNIPDPFFFNKTENQFQGTIALYDGFRLPLATKGFAFNYNKMGTKPKSWFMDPANMIDHRARAKQINFMRLEQVRAKLERRARPVYKNGKKPGRAVGYKMSRSYNYKNAHMVKFIQEKRKQGLAWNRITKQWVKKGEENKVTSEELKRVHAIELVKRRRRILKRNSEENNVTSEELNQIQATEVLKKRRKRSFKGNYAEFENLDGDNLTMNEVAELLPVASKEENKIPKKKRKIVDTNKDGVNETVTKKAKPVNKKVKKKLGKRKQNADKTKPVLLYSERKKPSKPMRIRKPGFLSETNENDGQDAVQNNSDGTDLLNVPVPPPQKRKPGRKPKDPAEKKLPSKKVKAPKEPVQPKYKYVKRAKQKKLIQENGHTEDNEKGKSSSVQGTKRKQTTDKPAAKRAKTNSGKKMQVKFTRNPKQTGQLSVSSQGMLHEAVAGSNLVRVHLPQNVNDRTGIPGLMNGQIPGPLGVDMRQVILGGKCLMYCDDVVVMRDLNSSQEIFGLGVNQIKTETFIEPVEPFSENQVFNTGAVVNSVHPVLLTQNPVGPTQHSIPLPTGIIGPCTVSDMGDTVIDDRVAMLRGGETESTDTFENDVVVNPDMDTRRDMVSQQAGTLLIREASTDKEVMQLDYSIVKDEPSDD